MAHTPWQVACVMPARLWALGLLCLASLLAAPALASQTLDAGWGHNLAVTPAGQVWAWGVNDRGQLGNATGVNSAVPVRAGTLTNVIAVSAGGNTSVALRSDLTVWTWGSGPTLGVTPAPQTCTVPDPFGPPDEYPCSRSPLQVTGLTGIKAIAAGGAHVLALRTNGTLVAWGANTYGQLGDGTTSGRPTPVDVPGINGVVAIAAGDDFSLALKSDGTLWSWGNGAHGEIGLGTAPQTCSAIDVYNLVFPSPPVPCSRSPARITALALVLAISAKGRHSLALTADKQVWAWGSSKYGQMGDGTTNHRFAPYAVAGLGGAAKIAAGFNHSIVVKADGTFWAFGLNHFGQLGTPGTGTTCPPGLLTYCVKTPTAMPQHNGAVDVVAGGAHTLTLRPNGSIVAFGLNGSGQLGFGLFPSSLVTIGTLDPHGPQAAGAANSSASIGRASSGAGLNLGALADGLTFTSTGIGVASGAQELRFTNLQETELAILSIATTGNFSQTNNCPAFLPADGAYCSIFVTFTPGGAGERRGALNVVTDSTEAQTMSLELSGTTPGSAFELAVSSVGAGSGTVTSSPAGISCGSACVLSFASGAALTLTAAPAAGSVFAGWGGACTGTGTCAVTMSAARSVTAAFNVASPAGAPNANPAVLYFGDQPIDKASTARTVTISNPGASSLTISSVTASTFFAVSSACGTLTPGASCSASVTFTPGTQGTLTGALTIVSSAGTVAVPLSGTGLVETARLGNISTRMQVLTGSDVMIGGFIIQGSAAKTVAIVATGPSLVAYGINNALGDPTLTLVRQSDQFVLATNDNWQSAGNAAQLQAAGFAPSHPQESAILTTLAPGAYTAIVSGAGGGTGVGIVAVYEVDHPEVPLANISTRGQVLTGNDVMIGGFIIHGNAPQTVAIVATGPSLAQYGIANPLANPSLVLVRQSDQLPIASNDDWQSAANAAQLQAAGFAPSNPKEAAILITLNPGAYTAVLSGADGGTGVGIVGVYVAN